MQLEEAKNLEHEERIRKEEEIRAKQEEIEEIRCCGNLLVNQARESSLVNKQVNAVADSLHC